MKKSILLPYSRYEELLKNEGGSTTTNTQDPTYSREKIIDTLPPKMRSRGETVLNVLQGIVSWNEKGELIVDGQCIEHSHISDLLRAVLCNYKNYTPVGLNEFVKVLAANNVPETIIQNIKCRLDVQQAKKYGTSTPTSSQPSWVAYF